MIYFSRDFNFSAVFVKTSNDFRVDPCDVKISQFGRDDDLGNFRPAETLSRFLKKQIKTNLLLKPRLISEHRKPTVILFMNILYLTLLRPFDRFRSKHSLNPNQLVNSHAFRVEYCLRCRDGHEAIILVLFYHFVG